MPWNRFHLWSLFLLFRPYCCYAFRFFNAKHTPSQMVSSFKRKPTNEYIKSTHDVQADGCIVFRINKKKYANQFSFFRWLLCYGFIRFLLLVNVPTENPFYKNTAGECVKIYWTKNKMRDNDNKPPRWWMRRTQSKKNWMKTINILEKFKRINTG